MEQLGASSSHSVLKVGLMWMLTDRSRVLPEFTNPCASFARAMRMSPACASTCSPSIVNVATPSSRTKSSSYGCRCSRGPRPWLRVVEDHGDWEPVSRADQVFPGPARGVTAPDHVRMWHCLTLLGLVVRDCAGTASPRCRRSERPEQHRQREAARSSSPARRLRRPAAPARQPARYLLEVAARDGGRFPRNRSIREEMSTPVPKACQSLADQLEAAQQFQHIQGLPGYIEGPDGPRPGSHRPLMEAEQEEALIRRLSTARRVPAQHGICSSARQRRPGVGSPEKNPSPAITPAPITHSPTITTQFQVRAPSAHYKNGRRQWPDSSRRPGHSTLTSVWTRPGRAGT